MCHKTNIANRCKSRSFLKLGTKSHRFVPLNYLACGNTALCWTNSSTERVVLKLRPETSSATGNALTAHPVSDDFSSLLGGALGEPVVAQQHRHLVGVHELPGHEGQGAKRHLLTVWTVKGKKRTTKRVGQIKQAEKRQHESRAKKQIKKK